MSLNPRSFLNRLSLHTLKYSMHTVIALYCNQTIQDVSTHITVCCSPEPVKAIEGSNDGCCWRIWTPSNLKSRTEKTPSENLWGSSHSVFSKSVFLREAIVCMPRSFYHYAVVSKITVGSSRGGFAGSLCACGLVSWIVSTSTNAILVSQNSFLSLAWNKKPRRTV